MRKRTKNKKQKILSGDRVYTCVFDLNEHGGYTVIVPALPGVVTEGRTLEEAKRMAREAIQLHCACLAQEYSSAPVEHEILVTTMHVPMLQTV